MKQITGNLFDQKCDAICITTNGFVKRNGEAVMGRGCALQASKRWPLLSSVLGKQICKRGNIVSRLYCLQANSQNERILCSFPVKPVTAVFDGTNAVAHMAKRFKSGDIIPGWAAKASLDIIERSAWQLVQLADAFRWNKVVLPRPGCGAGELKWHNVSNVLNCILDERFYSITY